MKKIACNVVTYNRKELLKRCLDAVVGQTYKPYAVYIIDNASTDGTIESVKSWGYYNSDVGGIKFKYILNDKNEGSSGGQYLGMKTAMGDDEYDGIWVMDDDGAPEKKCLEELCKHLDEYDYLAPIVLSDVDKNTLSFSYHNNSNKDAMIADADIRGMIHNYACPFNGILYSRRLIEKVGYPKREMFIWGDEINYDIRSKRNKFIPVTIVNAIHYHPVDRQVKERCLYSMVVVIDVPWKWYCFCRNSAYNKTIQYGKFKSIYYILLIYAKYTTDVLKKRQWRKWYVMNKAYWDGYKADFSKLSHYM